MARKATRTEIITPEKMAEMMTSLYPIRKQRGRPLRFRYDFVPYLANCYGYCINPSKSGKGIRRTLARYAQWTVQSYPKVLEEVVNRNTSILIVDPLVYKVDGWVHFFLVAIHEYAHFIRNNMGSIYRWKYGTNAFENTISLLSEFRRRVHGKGSYKKTGPMFGQWCVWDGDHEAFGHDPLFFFILYFLERKAQEMEYFNRNARPAYDKDL